MGIDRPDVEAVVHFEIPGSLEAYYQEIGRAGRDGRRAEATLLWNYVDVRTREFLIDRDDDEDPRRQRPPVDPAAAREAARPGAPEAAEDDRLGRRERVPARAAPALLRRGGRRRSRAARAAAAPAGRRSTRRASSFCARSSRASREAVSAGGSGRSRRCSAATLEGLPEPLARLSTTGLLAGERGRRRFVDAAPGGGLLAATDDPYRTLSLTPPDAT